MALTGYQERDQQVRTPGRGQDPKTEYIGERGGDEPQAEDGAPVGRVRRRQLPRPVRQQHYDPVDLSSRIWEVRNEIAAVKELFEGGIFVYGKGEHERRFREQLNYKVQNSERKAKDGAEAGDLSAQAHYGELLAIQGDYVQAYMWLHIAISRADEEPARVFRASAIGRRDKIAGEMTSEQITKAKAKSLEWLANYPFPSLASDAS